MADHHDIVDSALDLLRSRHWAGPNTNPILENALMQARTPRSRINLRLVLGLGAALIGCGAVAAATRPAWITTFLAQETKAATPPAPVLPVAKPTVVAAAQPPKVERRAAPAKAPVAAAPIAPAPLPTAPASVAVVEEPIETFVVSGMPIELSEHPAPSMIDAFFDSLLCGDYEACDHLAQIIANPAQGQWVTGSSRIALNIEGGPMMFEGIPGISAVMLQRPEVPMFLSVEGHELPAGDFTFTIDVEGEWLGAEGAGLHEIQVQGAPLNDAGAILRLLMGPAQPAQPLKP